MTTPGRLLASGRDSDIYECGTGLVLRRSRRGSSMEKEANVMELARSRGYPVPGVERVSDDGTELVMERIEGRTMADVLMRRPWSMRQQGGVLARLHQQLHAIVAPDWLPTAPGEPGDRLLHLDLHPLNVMITSKGPVVIDWPNAGRGDPSLDVAVAWLLVACAGIPTSPWLAAAMEPLRRRLVRSFLAALSDGEARRAREALSPAAAWKTVDANLTPAEAAAMHRLAEHPA